MKTATRSIVPPILHLAGLAALIVAAAQPLVHGQFASGVNLVEVYATVTDAGGRVVPGLEAKDFEVSEDGHLQTVDTFAAGEFPLAVAIGVDRSFSVTSDRLAAAKAGARALVSALSADDQVMVLAIGSETEIVAPLSTDRSAALAAIDRIDSWGTTPLYDATIIALDAIQPAKGRRALILLSDGNDRYSRTGAAETIEQARRRDVLVYPVTIAGSRAPIFAELATVTGGRSALVRDVKYVESTLVGIAHELRFQYLIGYAPARARDEEPRWRSIQVRVNRPNVRVRARDGYVSR